MALLVGYYPGKKPIRKKRRGRGPDMRYGDIYSGTIAEALPINALNVPGQIAKNLEKDLEMGLSATAYAGKYDYVDVAKKKYRFYLDEQYKSGAITEEERDDLEVEIEGELGEKPGAKGAKGISFETVRRKGWDAAITETWEGLQKSIFNYEELGVWDRLNMVDEMMDPSEDSTPEKAAMSLSPLQYAEKYQPQYPSKKLSGKDFKTVGQYARTIREYVAYSGSVKDAPVKFEKLQDHYILAMYSVAYMSPGGRDLDGLILSDETTISTIDTNITSLNARLSATRDPVTISALRTQIGDLQRQRVAISQQLAKRQGQKEALERFQRYQDDFIVQRNKLIKAKEDLDGTDDPDKKKDYRDKIKEKERALKTETDPVKIARLKKELKDLDTDLNGEKDPVERARLKRDIAALEKLVEDKKWERERRELWEGSVGGKFDNLAELSDDKTLIGWAKFLNYQKAIDDRRNLLEAIGEQKFFRTYIWTRIRKRVKLFSPEYYVWTKLFSDPGAFGVFWLTKSMSKKGITMKLFGKERTLLKLPNYMNLVGRITDRYMGGVARFLARNGLSRSIINIGSNAFSKGAMKIAARWVLGAAGASGVGTVPAILVAALQYMGEKAWGLLTKALKLDFTGVYEDFTKLFFAFFKAALVSCFIVGALVGLSVTLIFTFLVFPFTGTSTRTFGGGSVSYELAGDCTPSGERNPSIPELAPDSACKLGSTSAYRGIDSVPPTMQKILEAAGVRYGVPPSMILALFFGEGSFDKWTFTEESVVAWSRECAAMPRCNTDPDDNVEASDRTDGLYPYYAAQGPGGWLRRYWESGPGSAAKALDPNRSTTRCNLLDSVYATAYAASVGRYGQGYSATEDVCFGQNLNNGSIPDERKGQCSADAWPNEDVATVVRQYAGPYESAIGTVCADCKDSLVRGGAHCKLVDSVSDRESYSDPSVNCDEDSCSGSSYASGIFDVFKHYLKKL